MFFYNRVTCDFCIYVFTVNMWLWSHRCHLDVCFWHDKVLSTFLDPRAKIARKVLGKSSFFGSGDVPTLFVAPIEAWIAFLPYILTPQSFIPVWSWAQPSPPRRPPSSIDRSTKVKECAIGIQRIQVTRCRLLQGNILLFAGMTDNLLGLPGFFLPDAWCFQWKIVPFSVPASQLPIAKKQLTNAMNNLQRVHVCVHGWGEATEAHLETKNGQAHCGQEWPWNPSTGGRAMSTTTQYWSFTWHFGVSPGIFDFLDANPCLTNCPCL